MKGLLARIFHKPTTRVNISNCYVNLTRYFAILKIALCILASKKAVYLPAAGRPCGRIPSGASAFPACPG